MSLARGYNSDLGVDHWTIVKIILSRIRIYFSVMEVIKRFVVKSSSIQALTPIWMTLSLNLDTVSASSATPSWFWSIDDKPG